MRDEGASRLRDSRSRSRPTRDRSLPLHCGSRSTRVRSERADREECSDLSDCMVLDRSRLLPTEGRDSAAIDEAADPEDPERLNLLETEGGGGDAGLV